MCSGEWPSLQRMPHESGLNLHMVPYAHAESQYRRRRVAARTFCSKVPSCSACLHEFTISMYWQRMSVYIRVYHDERGKKRDA